MDPLPEPDRPDSDLLAGAAAGDPAAFAGFCARSLPTLLRYLTGLCRQLQVSEALAEDAAQEAFVRAVTHRRDDPTAPLTLGWLIRVGQNVVRDLARRSRRSIVAAELEDLPDPAADGPADDAELWAALERLSTADRTVIELVLVEELPMAEVAERLGVERWAAYKRYERAIDRLRRLIDG